MDENLKQLIQKLQDTDTSIKSGEIKLNQLIVEISSKEQLSKKKEQEIFELDKKKKKLEFEIKEKLESAEKSEKYVKLMIEKSNEELKKIENEVILNIGGTLFYTTKDTLTKQKNLFYFLFSSGNFKPNKKNEYFFDRNPDQFDIMLNYLREFYEDYDVIQKVTDWTKFVKEWDFYQFEVFEDHFTLKSKLFDIKDQLENEKKYRKMKTNALKKFEKEFSKYVEITDYETKLDEYSDFTCVLDVQDKYVIKTSETNFGKIKVKVKNSKYYGREECIFEFQKNGNQIDCVFDGRDQET
eukprot:gene12893-7312_t